MNLRGLAVVCLAVLAFALVVSACGGKSAAEKAREATANAASAGSCDASALSGDTGLPANFPEPDGVTYKKTKSAGPSVIVDATYDGDIDSGYSAYEKAVADANYKVLRKEKEEDDAEIAYQGDGKTGQIALRAACGEDDKIAVNITNRPGSGS
jgi:hypothetical protein